MLILWSSGYVSQVLQNQPYLVMADAGKMTLAQDACVESVKKTSYLEGYQGKQ